MAACQLALNNYPQAFQYLKQSRDLALQSSRPVNADTLVNTLVCLQCMGKSDVIVSKIKAELVKTHPQHQWIKQQQQLQDMFDKVAAEYKLE